MTSSTLVQLRQLQQKLYDKAYEEAHALGAASSRTMLAYSAKFESSLPRRFQLSTQTELTAAVRAHQFLLYGDFHTLRQSQRGLLRLIRSYVERHKTQKVVLALEMFKAVDQDYIDGYLAGALSEEDLLSCVNYATEWGFPWRNFKMILDFAKSRNLPVIGINTENAGRDSLITRDKFAARRLVDAAERYPRHKIVCLIGEYHLADQHLPQALHAELKKRGKKSEILRVLNNVDHFYFALTKHAAHASSEYLRLRKSFYCIMNSPPWMKWQSFALWEEMRHAGVWPSGAGEHDLGEDIDLYNEESFDVDYQFLSFVKGLAGFLDLTIDASDMESFHLHYSPDGDFFRDLTDDGGYGADEARRIISRASIDGLYFLPRSNTVLLTNLGINHLAEAAGQYLHTLLSGFEESEGHQAADFYRRILKSALGMVAAMILNPRRKCMEIHHYRQLVRRQLGVASPRERKHKLAAAILRFDRWMDLKLLSDIDVALPMPPRSLIQFDRDADCGLSRAIGQMLGYGLYKKVIAGKVPSARIRRLFKKNLDARAALWREIAWLYGLLRTR